MRHCPRHMRLATLMQLWATAMHGMWSTAPLGSHDGVTQLKLVSACQSFQQGDSCSLVRIERPAGLSQRCDNAGASSCGLHFIC